MADDPSWPPQASDLYRSDAPERPVFQGDVFDEIPFVKARSAGDPDRDPNLVVERRLVAVVGYPCEIYQGGKLTKVQTVAPVTSASKVGLPINWDGAYTYCPLPNLKDDGDLYAVEMRAMANIDASYLTKDRRIRSLSSLGWAIFRQRLTLCTTRVLIPLDALERVGEALFEEVDFWEQWCRTGRAEADFQAWLDEHDPRYSGFTRRDLLDRGQYEAVGAAMLTELSR